MARSTALVVVCLCVLTMRAQSLDTKASALRSNVASLSPAPTDAGCPKRVTPGDKKDFVMADVSGDCTSFQVKVAHDAHIGLFAGNDDLKNMYEIVIGNSGNKESRIRYGFGGKDMVVERTPTRVTNQDNRWFWVCWANGNVQVGTGRVAGSGAFMSWYFRKRVLEVTKAGISSGWGDTGYWRFPCQPAQQLLNLVTNGGFEAPNALDTVGKNWYYVPTAAADSTDSKALRSWATKGKNVGLTSTSVEWMPQGSAEGTQAALLQQSGSVIQRVKVSQGHPYTFSVAYARRWGQKQAQISWNAPAKLNIKIQGQSVLSKTLGSSFLDFHWQRFTVSFVADSDTVEIELGAETGGDDRTVLVDDVQLVKGRHTYVDVYSGGYHAPSYSQASVNGEIKMANSKSGRGINLLVIDHEGNVKQQGSYDTYGSSARATAFVQALGDVKDTDYLIVSFKDEATARLGQPGRQALARFGANIGVFSFRSAYVLVTRLSTGPLLERWGPNNRIISGTAFVPASITSNLDSHKKHSEQHEKWKLEHAARSLKYEAAKRDLQQKTSAHEAAKNQANAARTAHAAATAAAKEAKEALTQAQRALADEKEKLAAVQQEHTNKKNKKMEASQAIIAAKNKLEALVRDLALKNKAVKEATENLSQQQAQHRAAQAKLTALESQHGSNKRVAKDTAKSELDAASVAYTQAKDNTKEAKARYITAQGATTKAVNAVKAANDDINKKLADHGTLEEQLDRAKLAESRATAIENSATTKATEAQQKLAKAREEERQAVQAETKARESHEDAQRQFGTTSSKLKSQTAGVQTRREALRQAESQLQSEVAVESKARTKVSDARNVRNKAVERLREAREQVEKMKAEVKAATDAYTQAAAKQTEAEARAQSALAAKDDAVARHKEAEQRVLKAKAAVGAAETNHKIKQKEEANAKSVFDAAVAARDAAAKVEADAQAVHDKLLKKTLNAKEWMDSFRKRRDHYYGQYQKRAAPFMMPKAKWEPKTQWEIKEEMDKNA